MTKHVATPEGQTGRVRIEKKVFDTPADEVKTRVAVLKQTQPSLTEDQARQQVLAEHPHLIPAMSPPCVRAWGKPGVVTTPAPLTYEQVLKLADERVTKTAGWTRRDALAALAQEHPQEAAFHKAYRTYHLGAGFEEHLRGETSPR